MLAKKQKKETNWLTKESYERTDLAAECDEVNDTTEFGRHCYLLSCTLDTEHGTPILLQD